VRPRTRTPHRCTDRAVERACATAERARDRHARRDGDATGPRAGRLACGISFMQANALVRARTNWPALRAEARALSR